MIIPAERVQFALITPDDWDGKPADVARALEELAERVRGETDKHPTAAELAGIPDRVPTFVGNTAGELAVSEGQLTGTVFSRLTEIIGASAMTVHGKDQSDGPAAGGDATFRGGTGVGAAGGDVLIRGGTGSSSGVVKLAKADGTTHLQIWDAGLLAQAALNMNGNNINSPGNIDAVGDLMVGTGSNSWDRLAVGPSEEALLRPDSAESGGMRWWPFIEKVKTATESVTSSTTLQDDDHFSFTLPAANTTYLVEGCVFVQPNSGTPGIKMAFAQPSGFQRIAGVGIRASSTIVKGCVWAGTTQSHSLGASPHAFFISGLFHVYSGISTPFVFQWAQNVSDANATMVLSRSWMRIRETVNYF